MELHRSCGRGADTLSLLFDDGDTLGMLQYGMVDDGLYGLAVTAGVSTMAVSQERRNEDTWTFRDVMAIMGKRYLLKA